MQQPFQDPPPMNLMGLLIALRALRVRLDMDADGLRVDAPVGGLTLALQQAVRQHKAMLETLPRPFLRAGGELIIPVFAAPQYHWQPQSDTLRELGTSL